MVEPTKKAIGIFGGSFDPPHKGHLTISKISLKKLNLKKIYWIVAKKNPFKKITFFNINRRIKKCKDLTKKIKKIEVKFLDKLVKSSNTIDIVRYLAKKNRNTKFFLIIGSDNLINFHKWKSWKHLVKISQLVVFPRRGFDKKAKKSVITKYLKQNKIMFIKSKKIDISSSQLRKNYLS